ncbi:hypothetical protein D3C80_1692350 [compost metagenome]
MFGEFYQLVVDFIGPVPPYAEFVYILFLIMFVAFSFIVVLAPFLIFFGIIGVRK